MNNNDEEERSGVRVGLVSYLNVQPLVWAFEKNLVQAQTSHGQPLRFENAVPRVLASRLRKGLCQVGIVPIFEYFSAPGYAIIPAGAIATRRRVGSVLVVANAPLEELEYVVLDPASLTSANLLRVLQREYRWKFSLSDGSHLPNSEHLAQWLLDCHERAGQLLIGDPALAAIGKFPYSYDLGALWYELTGLPFVFAAWLVHPSAQHVPLLEPLSRAKEVGVCHLSVVAHECGPRFGFAPDFAERYFRENLCFDLGEDEIAGMHEFGKLCAKWGLCSPAAIELRFHQL
ncbi:MAG: menaquinone biosynthesis protein [Candidatus Sumerlaeaceae bacterium]|nr:menaquinone biosynthesis protein [Candidatus Sumerlaeaceae bacterium]